MKGVNRMFLNQVSVFLENSEGRLGSALIALKNEGIDIKALSLADTNDYGMLRMIVNNPEGALSALKTSGFSAHLTKVIAVKLANRVGALADLLKVISGEGFNIEYMYDLSSKDDSACMVIKVSDGEACARFLSEKGLGVLSESDI